MARPRTPCSAPFVTRSSRSWRQQRKRKRRLRRKRSALVSRTRRLIETRGPTRAASRATAARAKYDFAGTPHCINSATTTTAHRLCCRLLAARLESKAQELSREPVMLYEEVDGSICISTQCGFGNSTMVACYVPSRIGQDRAGAGIGRTKAGRSLGKAVYGGNPAGADGKNGRVAALLPPATPFSSRRTLFTLEVSNAVPVFALALRVLRTASPRTHF